jgi:hypothetical protein
MKTGNPGNRRFCNVGDIFYDTSKDNYMLCTKYFKRETMHYLFREIDNKSLKEFINNDLMTHFHSLSRCELDNYWDNKEWVNISASQEAKLNLLGIKFQ